MKSLKFLAMALITGLCLAAAPAMAKKPDYETRKDMYEWSYEHEKRHDQNEHRDHNRNHNNEYSKRYESHQQSHQKMTLRIDDHRRSYIHNYQSRIYKQKICPPGQAKKGRCHPPQNPRYHIGGQLPSFYQPVPRALRVEIGAPPPGTFYAMVDNDVVLVAEAGKKILDAVTLLSALH